MRRSRILVIMALCLALAGCQVATPSPSPSPAPTITIAPHVSGMDIVAAFMTAGIPAAKPISFTEYNDPEHNLGQPHWYIELVKWDDMRVNDTQDPYADTAIEIYADPADAKARFDAISAAVMANPGLNEHLFLRGIYLMRLSLKFTQEQAGVYEAVFIAAVSQAPTPA